MANLKFELVVDTTNEAELSATLAFLQALSSAGEAPKPKPAANKRQPKPEPVQETTTAPEETNAAPEEKKVSIPALEDLQKLVQEKSGNHRPELVAELKRLNVKGVTPLYNEYQDSKPEVIIDFETFVKGLK